MFGDTPQIFWYTPLIEILSFKKLIAEFDRGNHDNLRTEETVALLLLARPACFLVAS